MRNIKFSFLKIFFYLVHAFVFIAFINLQVSAEPVFEDNFDDHADWSPVQSTTTNNTCAYNAGCDSAPEGYVGYRVDKTLYSNAGNNTLNIDASNFRGNSGKSLTFWAEVCDTCQFNASDGLLDVRLDPAGHEDIYIRFFIKFDPNWQWNTNFPNNDGGPMEKFLHVSNYEGSGNVYDFFAPTPHKPLYIAQLAKWFSGTGLIQQNGSYMYEGLDSEFGWGDPTNDSFVNTSGDACYWAEDGCPGDGEWHSWEYQLKMNSAPGVADGIHRFWFDGVLIMERTDIVWTTVNGQENPRRNWNWVQLGGNNYNHYAPQSEEPEQFYAIDDFVISTTYVGPDYIVTEDLIFYDSFE